MGRVLMDAFVVGFLKFVACVQSVMAIILLLQQDPLADLLRTITAFGTFANLVVLVGLIYKVGRYTGTTDTTIKEMRSEILRVDKSLHDHFQLGSRMETQIQATQTKHGESLARLETQASTVQHEIALIRERQHQLANLMGELGLTVELRKEQHIVIHPPNATGASPQQQDEGG